MKRIKVIVEAEGEGKKFFCPKPTCNAELNNDLPNFCPNCGKNLEAK
jgi:hypothetical protein